MGIRELGEKKTKQNRITFPVRESKHESDIIKTKYFLDYCDKVTILLEHSGTLII